MPLIVCDKCENIANTSGSTYWHKNMGLYPPEHEGKVYCEDCLPSHYASGAPVQREPRGRKKTPATPENVARDSAHFIYLGRFEKYRTRDYGDHK